MKKIKPLIIVFALIGLLSCEDPFEVGEIQIQEVSTESATDSGNTGTTNPPPPPGGGG